MKGMIGKKIGMTQVFDDNGNVVPVTIIQAGPCHVTQIRSKDKEGYVAVQLGFAETKPTRLTKGQLGHLKRNNLPALRYLRDHPGLLTVNLGTGRPVSVLEMVRAFERASGRAVPYRIVARRPGDVAQCWADPALARQLLGWTAKLGLDQMCEDAWRWQSGVGASLQA